MGVGGKSRSDVVLTEAIVVYYYWKFRMTISSTDYWTNRYQGILYNVKNLCVKVYTEFLNIGRAEKNSDWRIKRKRFTIQLFRVTREQMKITWVMNFFAQWDSKFFLRWFWDYWVENGLRAYCFNNHLSEVKDVNNERARKHNL